MMVVRIGTDVYWQSTQTAASVGTGPALSTLRQKRAFNAVIDRGANAGL